MTKSNNKTQAAHGIRKQKITDLNKYIDDTITQSKKVEGRLHNASFACVERAMANGDIRPIKRLVDGLGKRSIRRNAMVTYFLAVAPVVLNEETNELELDKAKKDKNNRYLGDLETAWNKPFWDYKAMEGTDKPFDLEKAFINLAKRTAKRMQEGNEKDKMPSKLVAVLRELEPEVFAEAEALEVNETSPLKDVA